MENKKHGLNKSLMLKLKNDIQLLFNDGIKNYDNTLKIVWLSEKNSQYGVKIFISIPKRLIRKATKRNLLKRRIKEALRLNLFELKNLCETNNTKLMLGIVYNCDKIEKYSQIEQKIQMAFKKIYSKI